MTSHSLRPMAWLGLPLLLAAGAAGQSPGLQGVPEAPAGSPLRDPAVLEGVVREGYARLAALTATGGTPLRFELADYQLYSRAQLVTLSLADLVDLPGGDSISTTRSERFENDKLQTFTYEARWAYRMDSTGTEDERLSHLLNAEQLLVLAARDEPALLEVTAVSTFRVTVYLQGKAREYRALVWWIDRDPQSDRLDFIPNDNVVTGVAEAFSDFDSMKEFEGSKPDVGLEDGAPADHDGAASSVGPKDALEAIGSLKGPSSGPGKGTILNCESETETYHPPWQTNIAHDGHKPGGEHGVLLVADFSCSCTPSCGQTCSPTGVTPNCSELGARVSGEYCHVMSLATQKLQGATSVNTSGIQCAAAGACGLKKCLGCACGASAITIVFSGVEASYLAQAGTVAYGVAKNFICPVCTVLSPPPPPPPPPNEPYTPSGPHEEGSPLILDFGHPGFALTSLQDGVQFDISGDGAPEPVSWTDGEDAFLVLDRNTNGVVDGAMEIFGDKTAQPAATEPNGFLALAVFDDVESGGNADGSITGADSIFSALRLWFDRGHDGVSQLDELEPLAARGLTRIELGYVETRRKDHWGNQFRYLSFYDSTQGSRKMIQDVFFVVGAPDADS